MSDSANIAVIGAGVVGLTVARLLQAERKTYNITIIANAFKEDTTSAVAAGIFRPGGTFRGPTEEITQKWITDSWYYWQSILSSSEATQAGVVPLPAYIFSKKNVDCTKNPFLEKLLPIYRPVDRKEMAIFGTGFKYGKCFSTVRIGCDRYLPWAEMKFLQDGGKFINGTVTSFGALAGNFDLVFNCAGFGAKKLCGDPDLVPIRGQVVRVRAPWIKTALYGDYDAYVIPGFDGIATLGGIRQFDSYNTDVCEYDTDAILERCYDMFPSLEGAEVIGTRVGLRPYRATVRVEPQIVDGMKVVHCYGHGGYGVTCAPGTAIDAVNKGLAMLNYHLRNKL